MESEKEMNMSITEQRCYECKKLAQLLQENSALRHQLHEYATKLVECQNTNWLVQELLKRCSRKDSGFAEIIVYQYPKHEIDYMSIINDEPQQRISLEEIKVCFYFNCFKK